MIKYWHITGDTHRDFSRFKNYPEEMNTEENAVIILGDVGINYCLNMNDFYLKRMLMKKYHFYIYCVRGNHEARPSDVEGMQKIYDEEVHGEVYIEPTYPRIRYFLDYGEYTIDNYSVLILGGAYSVDKFYRIAMYNGKGWFPNEQLSNEEMTNAMKMLSGKKYDFVFTHTCPLEWEPIDMFLNSIDQKKVDKSMEIWMNEVKTSCEWGVWCFGHYHADRIERPYVEMYSQNTCPLEDIHTRWDHYKKSQELPWYLLKSPQFYWD